MFRCWSVARPFVATSRPSKYGGVWIHGRTWTAVSLLKAVPSGTLFKALSGSSRLSAVPGFYFTPRDRRYDRLNTFGVRTSFLFAILVVTFRQNPATSGSRNDAAVAVNLFRPFYVFHEITADDSRTFWKRLDRYELSENGYSLCCTF